MPQRRFDSAPRERLGLFTDLYELTMARGYRETDHNPTATFDLFFRELPSDRGYVVAAGLEQAVRYLDTLSFDAEELAYLESLGFPAATLEYLDGFEFTGSVRALPEGTVAFPNEPLLEVTAPIAEAQLFETVLLNQIGFQSLVATKAARMRDAVATFGDDQSLVEFGSRRAHGTDAGLKAARAAYVGGFDGTSNVAAGRAYGLPVFGTMAHSWVQSFPTERAAFEAFLDVYGERSVLLVDTYDTVNGARTAASVAADRDIEIAGVRLDSGDLVGLSKAIAPIVGDAGVFVTSGIDEYAIREFLTRGGVATGFGPGTALVTSADAPSLDAVYKLVAVEGDGEYRPTTKLSAGKVTYPGRKSVRRVERGGRFREDTLALSGESARGDEQLVEVFDGGDLAYSLPSLSAVRERARDQVRKLPRTVRELRDPDAYPVRIGDGLRATTRVVRDDLARRYRDAG